MARAAGAALLAALLAGCELAEIATPQGDDLLVVEAVLRAGDERQVVLLHRSLDGVVVRGEWDARVAILAPGGREVPLVEAPPALCTENLTPERTDSLEVRAACYATAEGSGFEVTPGATYELRVEAATGETVRGRTHVPGAFTLLAPSAAGGICALPPDTPLPLAWSQSAGTWSYLASMEIYGLRDLLAPAGIDAPEPLELTGLAITQADTTLLLPGQFGVFERPSLDQDLLRALQHGLPEGVRVHLVIAAADRNFVNGVRGGAFNPSGAVRISSVVGDGVGVFGSLVPLRLTIEVGTGLPHPPCP